MIDEILDKARWFYIPYRPYKTFYHLIVQNKEEDWTFYYLDEISSGGQIADVSGLGDLSIFFDSGVTEEKRQKEKPKFVIKDIPAEFEGIPINTIFRLVESKPAIIDREISGCAIIRQVHGNLGAMIHEFMKVVK